MSDSLRPQELQHARPPCPSPTPGVHSDSCPSSQWCHPAISSSVDPFSSSPQSLPASESFPMSQLFTWGGRSTGVSALASFLPKKSQVWAPSEQTGYQLLPKLLAAKPKELGGWAQMKFLRKFVQVPTMSNTATVTFIPGNSPAGLTAFTIIQVEFTSVHICLWTFFAYPTNPHLFLATSTHVFPSTICFNLHTALLPKDEEHFLLTNPCFSPEPGYFLPNLSFRPVTLWPLILLLLFTVFSRIIFTIQRWWVVLFSLW